ncbi:c-type cytochrome [Thermus thermamylovorans]|uniref:Cytochrome c n=1 Tax=Thermus thermamylovorans TaxID=2509362 RepID=A0A4Q9B514_9DEIN|nr:cytochrome c [Thermus thermamylovorans]TBH20921.1 cytochrome c [Thermus thermamylovorans]
MWDQPKVKAFRETPVSLAFPEDRVAFGENLDPAVRTGLAPEGGFAASPYVFPEEELLRGRVLYESFCAVCHGARGEGDGRVVPLGMPRPRPFPEVAEMPEGYFYFAATNGFGRMFSYQGRIPQRERWLIAHYIRRCLLDEVCPEEVFRAEVH